jgi:putative flippase GtrA
MILTKQFASYAIIGLTTNGLSFLGFAVLTWLGLSPVYAISIIYPVQISFAFILNKSWTFSHEGSVSTSAVRYLIAYVGCYGLNVAVLKYFNGYWGYSHLLVQAVAVVVIVPLLFVTQKLWVFREDAALILRAQDL